jgi:hypothetical protein
MTETSRIRYVALRIVESACFVHGTVRPAEDDPNRIDLQFVMEFEEAHPDLASWIASGKRVVVALKILEPDGQPLDETGPFVKPVLHGGEIVAPTGAGDSASVALFVSRDHFDFLAAHRAQWDRLLVRVTPGGKGSDRHAITGYTFTDRKAR